MDLLTGYRFEIEAYNRLVDTEDRHEGVRAFNEKRKAGVPRQVISCRIAPITSAACCVRRSCARRFANMLPAKSMTARFSAIQDECDPRGRQAAARLRPAGGHRRRVPPHLLLGEVRPPDARAWRCATRCSPSTTRRATRAKFTAPYVAARSARGEPITLDEFRVSRTRRSPCRRRRPCISTASRTGAAPTRDAERVLRRPGQGLPAGDRRPGQEPAAATCSSTRWRWRSCATRRRAPR